jgi:hypothetical protein
MRASLSFGSLGLVALVTLVACAASEPTADAPPATDVGTTTPAPLPEPATPKDDGGAGNSDTAPPKPKNDCKLSPLVGVADVSPTFEMHAPPTSAPQTMTGGTLQGEYRVDTATVFLPSGSAGLVDPKKSTGTINAWAVFNGTNYRLYLKADFVISSVIGPQQQGADTASQGAFAVSGAVLTLDHACDSAIAEEADYSFTDTGGGRAVILIKTPSPYGDTYLQLDAAKN